MERLIVNPWTWQDAFGFVQANRLSEVGRQIVCSGQLSVDAEGSPLHAGDCLKREYAPHAERDGRE
jgi:hypothetical protein